MTSVQCGFCGKKKASVEAAIEGGWYPTYWFTLNGVEFPSDRSVCPKDAARHCHDPGDMGELVVRLGHERFLRHDPAYQPPASKQWTHRESLRRLRGRR